MVTRIYLWESNSLKRFGHIALELQDGTYISWWPVKEMEGVMEAIAGSEGMWFETFLNELGKQGSPNKTFYLRDLDEEKMKAYHEQLRKDSTEWNLMGGGCSAVIYKTLCEGSKWFKNRAGKITTPKAVAELAEAYVKEEEKNIVLSS